MEAHEVIENPEAQETQVSPEIDVETRAKMQGWSPQEKWRGDPDDWVDAETFLERGEKTPIIKERLTKMERELANQKLANQKLYQYHLEVTKRQEAKFQKEIDILKRQQRKAAEDGDLDKFDAIEQDITELSQAQQQVTAAVTAPAQMQEDGAATLAAWIEDGNEWYVENTVMAREAKEVADRVFLAKKLTGRAQLDEVTRIMKKNYPEAFGLKPRTPQDSKVHGGNDVRPASAGGKKTYADLPADAKRICDEFVRDIPGFTREQFVKDFDWR